MGGLSPPRPVRLTAHVPVTTFEKLEPSDWSGALGAKYALSNGTKRVSSLTLSAETAKQWEWGRLDAGLSAMRSEDSSLDVPENTLIDGRQKFSYFLSKQAYIFESADYKRDTLNVLDYRVFALAGPGFNI